MKLFEKTDTLFIFLNRLSRLKKSGNYLRTLSSLITLLTELSNFKALLHYW